MNGSTIVILRFFQKIMPIIFICIFTFALLVMISPKFRAKILARQMKMQKYFLEENEEMLKEINRKGANISKEGVEITASAIKKRIFQ